MAWQPPGYQAWPTGARTEDIQAQLIAAIDELANDVLVLDKRYVNILNAMCVLIFRNNMWK